MDYHSLCRDLLVDNNILTHMHDELYSCHCGAVIEECFLFDHFASIDHRVTILERRGIPQVDECFICYEDKIEFHTCARCSKRTCIDCKTKLYRCPFCRFNFLEEIPDDVRSCCFFIRYMLELLNHTEPYTELCSTWFEMLNELYSMKDTLAKAMEHDTFNVGQLMDVLMKAYEIDEIEFAPVFIDLLEL